MGLRFRKSINLGGGFRVNISKSGIGYSWGTKGYRVTKKSTGGTRRTMSIPGTGVSHVSESKGTNKKHQHYDNVPNEDTNTYDSIEISNGDIDSAVSAGTEDIIKTARHSLKLNLASTICMIISALFILFSLVYQNTDLNIPKVALFIILAVGATIFIASLIWKIVIHKCGIVNLDYTIEEDQRELIDEHMKPLKKIAGCSQLWHISQSSKVIDKKYSGGATNSLTRNPCSSMKKIPFPFQSNESAVCFKFNKEKLVFLPDKFLIIKKTKVGILDYSDLIPSFSISKFIEDERVPSDAKIVDRTWQYVNKSGGPDSRFSNNKELPVCLYGKLELKTSNGSINTVIMFSNPDILEKDEQSECQAKDCAE